MKTTLTHLPEQKQQEIIAIAETLVPMVKPEMIILFGSYARGSYVNDSYSEYGITYTYTSDFDFLVIVEDDERRADIKEKKIRERLRSRLHHELPVQVIVHGLEFLNNELQDGHYFFTDIAKEGILLYDTQKFQLAEPKILSSKERAKLAQINFDKWFVDADRFLDLSNDALIKQYDPQAAFLLHQATERYFTTIELVFTHYKPKTHDLVRLNKSAVLNDDRFKAAFPQTNEEEKRLFMILHKAYIDARYKLNYNIAKPDLEYLSERVKLLKELTEEICKEKIRKIKDGE